MTLRLLYSTFSILALALLPAATAFGQEAEESEPILTGRIVGKTYISPTGAFKIDIPVLPELGGDVSDTPFVVTFEDDVNTHISIACFQMDAEQRWQNETRGRKDYLIWFFANMVQADFESRYPGAKIESARFNASLQDGALFTFNLLPGGSVFERKVLIAETDNPPVAKRGNLLFVKNEHVFILSLELAEKVLERSTYSKTPAQEDEILRNRLMDLLNKMSFTPPKKAAGSPAAASKPAPAAPPAATKSSK
jgi:hypothetical protein